MAMNGLHQKIDEVTPTTALCNIALVRRADKRYYLALMHEEFSAKPQPLLPLNALRAFEAIARHMSFARAAAELHVTPAALSHQIRGLEEQLGLPLFTRRTRSIELTEARHAPAASRPACRFQSVRGAVARLDRGAPRTSW